MEMEREEPAQPIDIAAIGRALECYPEQRSGSSVFEYRLRNHPLGLSLRLSVDPERRTVSLYLRGPTAFLGFVHIANIQGVSIDPVKGEVSFGAGDPVSELSIQSTGVFLAISRSEPQDNDEDQIAPKAPGGA